MGTWWTVPWIDLCGGAIVKGIHTIPHILVSILISSYPGDVGMIYTQVRPEWYLGVPILCWIQVTLVTSTETTETSLLEQILRFFASTNPYPHSLRLHGTSYEGVDVLLMNGFHSHPANCCPTKVWNHLALAISVLAVWIDQGCHYSHHREIYVIDAYVWLT